MAVPVRFILACEDGHLDEFPWDRWIQHREPCPDPARRARKELRLESVGAGLSGLRLTCTGCGASRPLQAAFDREVMSSWRCSGRRPWLATSPETCSKHPKTLQRGASNLYFPVVQSSLLIPPWDDDLELRFGDHWPDILELDVQDRERKIRTLLDRGRVDIPADWDVDRFIALALERAGVHEAMETPNLRDEEWQRFVVGGFGEEGSRDFEVRAEEIPGSVESVVAHIVRVVRLRELRALRGFTRINPPASPDDVTGAQMCALSMQRLRWLPAVEVRGEGIFIALDTHEVARWERQQPVRDRTRRSMEALRMDHKQRYGADTEPTRIITPRMILVHSLAHALIRQLSLECGYSTASLRERLYATDSTCGFLVYTATTDADGTLGGLQRQGESRRIGSLLRAAIESQRWCSSDPLCISGAMTASTPTNGAACHACMLAPETSCEEYNRFLDRAFLVGIPGDPQIGFFHDWLR